MKKEKKNISLQKYVKDERNYFVAMVTQAGSNLAPM